MKANAFSVLALALLISALPASAQQKKTAPKTSQNKTTKSETIVIREQPDDGKTTIELRDGNLYINGDVITTLNGNTADLNKKIIVEHDNGGSSGGGRSGSFSSRRAMLGVLSRQDSNNGAIIDQISPNSAAERAGLKEGDKIKRINDKSISNAQELVDAIAQHEAGDKVDVLYERDGKERTATAELGKANVFANPNPHTYGFNLGNMPNFELPNGRGFWFDSEDFMAAPPRLGITGEDLTDESGVRIADIKQGSVAEAAGLQKGDIIYKLGGKDITSISSLQNAVRNVRTGSPIKLKYERNGKDYETEVTFTKPARRKDL